MSRISFVLPAYKALYLEAAIRSILEQSSPDWELIIVDDCSPEDLKSVVDQFDDKRISYFRNEVNIGGKNLVAQWNHCIGFAGGDWIVMAADDDIYAPDFCKEVLSLAGKYPGVDLIRTRVEQIGPHGEHIWDDGDCPEFFSPEQYLEDWMDGKLFTCVGNFAFRRKALESVGGFKDFPCAFCSDIATPLMLSKGGVACTADMLFKFRQSDIHLSGDSSRRREKMEASQQFYEWLKTFAPDYSRKRIHEKCIYDCFNQTVKYASLFQLPSCLKACREASGKEKAVMAARWLKRKTVSALLAPFGDMLWFFLTIWLFTSAADCWFWVIHGKLMFGPYMASHGLILSYAIVFVCQIFRGSALKWIQGILIGLGAVNMIADTMVHSIMHFGFTKDMVGIILGSNPSEAKEFLPMYVNPEVVCFALTVLAIAVCIRVFKEKWTGLVRPWMRWAMLAACILSAAVIVARESKNWEGVFLCKIRTFLQYETPVDLRPLRSTPEVAEGVDRPEKLVLIIGESLSRNHCSLYGYGKRTQPRLEGMKDSLMVFEGVESPFTHTVESFKRIMSSYSGEDVERWYEGRVFLMDVMKAAGYETYWISNQSSAGIYDNIVTKFAQLADSAVWVGTKGMGIGKHDFDELLVPEISKLASAPGRKFIVVHLMGSHEGFGSRYPESFARFSAEDYLDRPEGQRQTLAEYDNSVLYNDYVVSSLIRLFDKDSSLVVYFPDHGLDVFDTDPEYAGHARTSVPESFSAGVKIPMVAYGRVPESLKDAAKDGFNTGDIMDCLL